MTEHRTQQRWQRPVEALKHWREVFMAIGQVLWLKPSQRSYLKALRQSGCFDRHFYRSQNPQLMGLYLALPERHYIVHGEAAGLFPNPRFSPQAYLRYQPEVAASGLAPLQHYLEAGQPAHAQTRDPSPVDPQHPAAMPSIQPRPAQHPIAVVVHIFYPELWPELDRQLQASGLSVDRLITITDLGPTSQQLAQHIQRDYPHDQVWLMPNHGRDIYPWVALINARALDDYALVCKLHTKRSPHLRDGEIWRRGLLDGLLPAQGSEALLQAFTNDPALGLLVTAQQHLTGPKWWGANQVRTMELLARHDIPCDPGALNFAAGSMFWVKASVISAIQRLQLTAEDFEPEQGGTDGSTAHAFERLLGYLVAQQGQRIGHTESLTAKQRS